MDFPKSKMTLVETQDWFSFFFEKIAVIFYGIIAFCSMFFLPVIGFIVLVLYLVYVFPKVFFGIREKTYDFVCPACGTHCGINDKATGAATSHISCSACKHELYVNWQEETVTYFKES